MRPEDAVTEKDKMLSGELYDANNDEALLAERAHAKELCYDFNQLRPSDAAGQRTILRELLGEVGKGACVTAPLLVRLRLQHRAGRELLLQP